MHCFNSCLSCCRGCANECPLWRSAQNECPNCAACPCTRDGACGCADSPVCNCRDQRMSPTTRDQMQEQQQQSIMDVARLYEPVYIDVIVPQVAPQSPESVPRAQSRSSVSTESQTIYSLHDINHSAEPSQANLNNTAMSNASYSNNNNIDGVLHTLPTNPAFSFDNTVSFSFTNNFREVNTVAVSAFLENVEKLIEHEGDEMKSSEEIDVPGNSFISSGGGGGGGGATTASTPSIPLAKLMIPGPAAITSEENNYIHAADDLDEMAQRVAEVEHAARQNIVALWNVNHRLLELAALRIVPTLRTHRHVDVMQDCSMSCGKLAAETTATAMGVHNAASHPHCAPVLVIHAGDVTLDQSASSLHNPGRKKSSCLPSILLKSISPPLIKVIDPVSESCDASLAGAHVPALDPVGAARDGPNNVNQSPSTLAANDAMPVALAPDQEQQQKPASDIADTVVSSEQTTTVQEQAQAQLQQLPQVIYAENTATSAGQTNFAPIVCMPQVKQQAASPVAASLPHTGGNYVSTVHHIEMLALSCHAIKPGAPVGATIEYKTWDFLSTSQASAVLNRGDCIFRFVCSPVNQLDAESVNMIDTFINVSSFANEQQQNNTPVVHIKDPETQAQYIAILVKAMYMLPNVRLDRITPAIISSYDYQKACQPSGNKVERCQEPNTFRINLTIIRFVFSMTVQFKVSEITNPAVLQMFQYIDGIAPVKALLLERTKRNIQKVDSTAKVRSVLLYYAVNGGLLVSNQTIVLNTNLPSIVSKIINTFGSSGASQSQQTVMLTRMYLAKNAH